MPIFQSKLEEVIDGFSDCEFHGRENLPRFFEC